MKVLIETPRTILRSVIETDLRGIYETHLDAETRKFAWIEGLYSPEEILKWIIMNNGGSESGNRYFSVIHKQNATFLGICGLRERPDLDFATDITYRIHPGNRLQGIATESANALLSWGIEFLRIRNFIAQVHAENAISHRVMQKLRFSLEESSGSWWLYRFNC